MFHVKHRRVRPLRAGFRPGVGTAPASLEDVRVAVVLSIGVSLAILAALALALWMLWSRVRTLEASLANVRRDAVVARATAMDAMGEAWWVGLRVDDLVEAAERRRKMEAVKLRIPSDLPMLPAVTP